MNYLVTGATGFIGRFLVESLAERGTVHVLVREQSADKFEGLKERLGDLGKQLKPVWGDIAEPAVIGNAKARAALVGKIDHVFHLAAIYDMNMDDEVADRINNAGTRNVVQLVNDLVSKERTPTLHHVSSVAVAGGDFSGTFTESMFDEGQSLNHPYFRTKFQSEGIVRDEAQVPIRIYRPGMATRRPARSTRSMARTTSSRPFSRSAITFPSGSRCWAWTAARCRWRRWTMS